MTAAVVGELLSDWAPVYHSAVAATAGFTAIPMRLLPADWRRRRDAGAVTIVGDAAHVMPPFGGVGVNVGLVNAARLATALTDDRHATVVDALVAYEQEMVRHAAPAQADTAQSEVALHSDVSLEELMAARDAR